jgi:hypothetical protein
MRAPALLLALSAAGLACGGSHPTGAADGGGDGGVDPRLYDCTSLGPAGDHLPGRASPVPVACALDPACRTAQISGHRGAGGDLGNLAPQDTLAAYRAGIALGIEYGETDPRPTADGVLVNIHDPTVDATTDGTGLVSDLTFDQIRALHPKTFGMPGDFACEKIPTLTEVLRTCRGRTVVLVDANKTDRVDLLVGAIHEADALEWAIFDTSDVAKIDAALLLEPGLHFQIRPRTVPDITVQLDHFAPRLPAMVELSGDEWADGAPIVHARGARVFSDVFTADLLAIAEGDLSLYWKALDAGVDVLEADRPVFAIAALKQRKLR